MSITYSQKDEIVATTLEKMTTEVINHTILANPIYSKMVNSPYRQSVSGGYRIRYPIIIDNNESFAWFGWGGEIDPQRKEILGWSHSTLMQAAGNYVIEWLEEQINSGPGAFVNMMNAKKQDLINSINNALNRNAWGDGTEAAGLEPVGLRGNIPSTPNSGTYNGFSRVTEFWSRVWYLNGTTFANSTHGPHDLDAPQDNTPVACGAIGDISEKYNLLEDRLQVGWDSIMTQGESPADMFHAVDYATYHDWLKTPKYCPGYDFGIHDGSFNLGWEGVTFMGAPIIPDTTGMGAPSGEWRMANGKYMPMVVDEKAFFDWVPPKTPYNALVTAYLILLRFCVVNTFPRRHAFFGGITTWQP